MGPFYNGRDLTGLEIASSGRATTSLGCSMKGLSSNPPAMNPLQRGTGGLLLQVLVTATAWQLFAGCANRLPLE